MPDEKNSYLLTFVYKEPCAIHGLSRNCKLYINVTSQILANLYQTYAFAKKGSSHKIVRYPARDSTHVLSYLQFSARRSLLTIQY